MKRNNLLNQLVHLFYPNVCVVCGGELLPGEEGACLQCLYKLPKTYNFREVDNDVEKLMAGRIPRLLLCLYQRWNPAPFDPSSEIPPQAGYRLVIGKDVR